VPPLIVTLGTLGMALGSALLITGGIDVRGVPLQLTTTIGIGQLAGVPYVVIIAAAVTAVGAVTLSIGKAGVEQAIAALKGEPVQKKIGTGFVVVTKENMNDPDVKPFLYKSSC
jgi:ribose transport system permease protein